MSERNGDKARFGRERRQRILRQKQTRESRKALETKNKEDRGKILGAVAEEAGEELVLVPDSRPLTFEDREKLVPDSRPLTFEDREKLVLVPDSRPLTFEDRVV
jgi:predicted ribosome-associated RNA-binding protein Tma20